MYQYLQILGLCIPMYGILIAAGVISSNFIALKIVKKNSLDQNDFIILEAYSFLGAFLGAKVLYLCVSYSSIDWSRILELDYFNQLMRGGFVFYGGLVGGLAFIFLAGEIHRIKSVEYLRSVIFMIPWMHCFGRIGCFFAGCCYGIPYNGYFSVVFPKGSFAPANIELFPVQLVEAFGLMIIAIIILNLEFVKKVSCSIEIYLLSYSILRFITEFFRHDSSRGKFFTFSTSQWISILVLFGTLTSIILKSIRKINE